MEDRIKLNGKEHKIVFDFEAYGILEDLWGFKSMLDFGKKITAMANSQISFKDAKYLLYAGLNRAGVARDEIDNYLNNQKNPLTFIMASGVLNNVARCFVESFNVDTKEDEKKAVKNG